MSIINPQMEPGWSEARPNRGHVVSWPHHHADVLGQGGRFPRKSAALTQLYGVSTAAESADMIVTSLDLQPKDVPIVVR